MKQKHINIPIGVLDTDSDLIAVSPEDYTYSTGLRQYPGEKVRRSIKGNELKSYTQPAGDNVTIGTAEDNYRKTLIDFVKNRARNHHIRRFFEDGRYETLMQGSILNFDSLINEAVVIDGKHLFWTDATGENPSGNPPRYIDMDYISLYQKQLSYELYWDQDSFTLGDTYSIRIEELDGTIVTPTTLVYTAGAGSPDFEAEALHTALAGGGFDIETEFCGNKIKVTATNPEQRVFIVPSGNDIHFPGTNHYPTTIIDQYISLIRMMPRIAPKPRFVNDPAITDNKVFGFTFQFRYRYLYWNGAKSKWSPISYVPTNFITDGEIENSEEYNKIEIDFIDDIMASQGWKHFVRKIEVAVRYEFSGVWRSVGSFDIADFGVSSSVGFEFLNNGSYPVIPSDENSSGDTQALGNFDFVPKLTRAMELVQDENGNHRLAIYGNLERFNSVDCVDVDITTQANFPVNAPATAIDQTKTRTLFKRGGKYEFFVRYEDDYGRQWADVPIGEFNPDWANDSTPRITLNHKPPIDATRFRLAVSRNQNQSTYIQLPSFKIDYWIVDQADGSYTSTTYAAGNADLVGFQFVLNDLETPINFSFRDDNKQLLVQPGDRLHVNFTDEDYLIEGYNLTDPTGTTTVDRYTVFIKFDAGQPDYTLTGGPTDHLVVELYRPLNSDSGIAYEVGDPIAITDPGLSTRSHGGAIDILNLGDTYNFSRNFINLLTGTTPEVLVSGLERAQLYGFKQEVGPDFGRASTIDPDYREVDAYDQVRVSDLFTPDSSVNGLHSFRGLEYIRTRRDYGTAQSLQYVGGVLLAIGQFGTQPIYVGKARLMDLSGDTSVGRTSKILNIANELSARLGTHNPESIINTGKYVYGWDGYNGVPWRYSVGGGIDEINYKNINKFRELGRSSFPTRQVVLGGYEPDFETYYLTFKDPLFPQTLGFAEKTPGNTRMGWEGNFPFIPEYYGRVGQRMFSFRNGLAYEHEIGDTLYGITYVCDLTVVVNSSPKSVKIFWNTEIQGDKWWIPVISVPPGTSVNGMSSRVVAGKLQKYEGVWKVDLPRDGNDPLINPPPSNPILFINSLLRGRRLRGDAMEMTFRLVDSQGVIKRIETEFSFSEETKK